MNFLIPLLALITTSMVSWWLLGRLIPLLMRHQMVDIPNQRSMHSAGVPLGGGLVIMAILVFVLALMAFFSARPGVFGALAALMSAWAWLGWWDDRHDLSPRRRLLFQLLFTLLTLLAFGYVTALQLSAATFLQLSVFGAVLSFLGVIWLANLYNFMDGMDGLAANQTIIAAITMAFWFWYAGDQEIALSCVALAGASYGFLLWNWLPAKIFMGDTGSIAIGAFFATLIVYGNTRYQLPVVSFILLLGVFVFDASITLLRRLLKREKIWLPHSSHFYQRLAHAGVNRAKTVIILTLLMVVCSVISTITVIDHDRIALGTTIELSVLLIYAGFVVLIEFNSANTGLPANTGTSQDTKNNNNSRRND